MKKAFIAIALLASIGAVQAQSNQFQYEAQLTCAFGNGMPAALFVCMQNRNINSDLEVRNGDDYSMSKFYALNVPNSQQIQSGISIDLRKNFEIKVQNVSNQAILNIKIYDKKTNKKVFEKSAGQFDVINVRN